MRAETHPPLSQWWTELLERSLARRHNILHAHEEKFNVFGSFIPPQGGVILLMSEISVQVRFGWISFLYAGIVVPQIAPTPSCIFCDVRVLLRSTILEVVPKVPLMLLSMHQSLLLVPRARYIFSTYQAATTF